MARDKTTLGNQIDNSDLVRYPNGRIKDNPGDGTGTPVDERVYGDIHENNAFLLRRYGINYNNLPDNTVNGYQFVDGMRALPSKNDRLLTIGSFNSSTLSVDVKVSFLENNEVFLARASLNYTSSFTTIRGSDNATKAISVSGNFLNDEYVYLINTPSNILIIRAITFANLQATAAQLGFLRAATQSQENAGTINTAATSPLTNLVAFIRRVNGADSSTYLASASQNGLLSAAQFQTLTSIGQAVPRNIGSISGINPRNNTVNSPLVVSGNIISATARNITAFSQRYSVVLFRPMDNNNYLVRISIQDNAVTENGSGVNTTIRPPIFRISSQSLVNIIIGEASPNQPQNLTLHLETIQL